MRRAAPDGAARRNESVAQAAWKAGWSEAAALRCRGISSAATAPRATAAAPIVRAGVKPATKVVGVS
jgi:hypothetical protein